MANGLEVTTSRAGFPCHSAACSDGSDVVEKRPHRERDNCGAQSVRDQLIQPRAEADASNAKSGQLVQPQSSGACEDVYRPRHGVNQRSDRSRIRNCYRIHTVGSSLKVETSSSDRLFQLLVVSADMANESVDSGVYHDVYAGCLGGVADSGEVRSVSVPINEHVPPMMVGIFEVATDESSCQHLANEGRGRQSVPSLKISCHRTRDCPNDPRNEIEYHSRIARIIVAFP